MAKIVKVEYVYNDLGRLVEKKYVTIETSHDWPTPEHSSTEHKAMEAYADYLMTKSWD